MSNAEYERSSPAADQRVRMVREPNFTPLDVAAFAVTLVMVCGPLAFGALGL